MIIYPKEGEAIAKNTTNADESLYFLHPKINEIKLS